MQKLKPSPIRAEQIASRCIRGRQLPISSRNARAYTTLNPRVNPPLTTWRRPEPKACSKGPSSIRWAPNRCHSTLRQTALYEFHVEHGGRMVPFGGYSMPVQYNDQSIVESHHFTREKASLFDVGHMVQHHFSGPDAQKLLEQMTPSDLSALEKNHSTLSCLLLPSGGIVDDTVITRLGDDSFYVVTNAGCRDKDLAFIQSQIEALPEVDLKWEQLTEHGLLALQGPEAVSILASCLSKPAREGGLDLQAMYFGQCEYASLVLPSNGHQTPPVLISRGGYTGEDGFEISLPPAATLVVAQGLLAAAGPGRLRLAGLGARDSLRLEAGMCLYGNDLDESVTPAEAALGWVVGKGRREHGGFNGADIILPQLKTKKQGGTGVKRRRVGLVVQGAPARQGAKIVDPDSGEEIGTITSGCPSPTLGKNIAMGYVKDGLHKAGTPLAVEVRGKRRAAEVTKMPFGPSKFYRPAITP